MERRPMKSVEGLRKLLRVATPEQIAVVEITSRQRPDHSKYPLKIVQSELGIEIPQERRFQYTAPNDVGCASRMSWYFDNVRLLGEEYRESRVEQVPKITDPNLTYIVFDDVLELGHTLWHAVNRLGEQGVDEKRIWASIGAIICPKSTFWGSFLDKPQVFFDYIENKRKKF